jgi:hypothetical protein
MDARFPQIGKGRSIGSPNNQSGELAIVWVYIPTLEE